MTTWTRTPSSRPTGRPGRSSYRLSATYRALFDDVVGYARGQVQDRTGTALQQRIRWWSALSLLRALASSPAAAAATLETRAAAAGATSAETADSLGRASVMDQVEDEALDGADAVPGAMIHAADSGAEDSDSPTGEPPTADAAARRERRLLRDLQHRAEALSPAEDHKLSEITTIVKRLLAEGFQPIVFCRFIQTADYVGEHLRTVLPSGTAVEIVTGTLPPEERAARVRALAETEAPKGRVLVATDCLSEGVNLQQDFQAVVHYDLAWNPTRHEQREGRVDRFGQPRDIVRAVTLYGEDNGIDGIVLEVLLRKHEQIRRDLGISVPVPNDTNDRVLGALLEGLLLRGREGEQLALDIDARGEIDGPRRGLGHHGRQGEGLPHPVRPAHHAPGRGGPGGGRGARGARQSGRRRSAHPHRAARGRRRGARPAARRVLRRHRHPSGRSAGRARTAPGRRCTSCTDLPAPSEAAVLVRTDPRVAALGPLHPRRRPRPHTARLSSAPPAAPESSAPPRCSSRPPCCSPASGCS